jgi:hypothetical protein
LSVGTLGFMLDALSIVKILYSKDFQFSLLVRNLVFFFLKSDGRLKLDGVRTALLRVRHICRFIYNFLRFRLKSEFLGLGENILNSTVGSVSTTSRELFKLGVYKLLVA